MKFYKLMALVCVMLAILLAVCACNKKDSEDSTNTEGESSTEEETVPRFDYFAADMDKYMKVDSSVYENVKVELDDIYKITEDDLQKRIDQLCVSKKTEYTKDDEGMSEFKDKKKLTGHPIEYGDSAFIFYEGNLKETGETFDGGSNYSDASPYELSIGSGSFIDGFEEGLIGVIPNDTSFEKPFELNLTFPKDYTNEDLAGKEVIFSVYVVWTVKYKVPAFDETFITETLKWSPDKNSSEKDVVKAYRKYLLEQLETSMESAKESAIESAIWDYLYDNTTVDIYPDGEVEYYYDAYCDEIEYLKNYYTYMGYSYDSVDAFAIAYLGLEKGADWKAELRKNAQNAVKQTLITHAIAKSAGLELTDEEFEAEVQRNIDYYKTNTNKTYTREEVIELVGEEMIKEGALYDKVIGYVKEHGTVEFKPVSDSNTAGDGAADDNTTGGDNA